MFIKIGYHATRYIAGIGRHKVGNHHISDHLIARIGIAHLIGQFATDLYRASRRDLFGEAQATLHRSPYRCGIGFVAIAMTTTGQVNDDVPLRYVRINLNDHGNDASHATIKRAERPGDNARPVWPKTWSRGRNKLCAHGYGIRKQDIWQRHRACIGYN